VKVNGKEAYRWVKRRPRNEVLDNRNYALHAAFGLGLHNYTDKRWSDLEASVQPARDLFSTPAPHRATPHMSGEPAPPVSAGLVSRDTLAAADIDIFSPIALN
jgi:phage terminase large subunit GpA-like protein